MFLFGNMTGSSSNLRDLVCTNFHIIDVINKILESQQELPPQFAQNYVWIANNISEEYRSLSIEYLVELMKIFSKFIDDIYVDNEDMLIDIVKGMSNLASHPEVAFINIAAGPEEIIDVVLRLLQHKNERIFSPMVKYLGGIMNSDNAILTSAYLEKGVLDQLGSILFSSL